MKQTQVGEYAMYLPVGQTKMRSYWGIVSGPLLLNLVDGISMIVDNVRIVQHLCPLFLIEANILSEGCT